MGEWEVSTLQEYWLFYGKKDFYTPYVIGVSMGACNATSYVSKTKKREIRL